LGKPLIVSQTGNTVSSGQGVIATTHTEFLGSSKNLVEASVEAIPQASASPSPGADPQAVAANIAVANDPGVASASPTPMPIYEIDLGRTDLYIDGFRIWTGDLSYQNGELTYSGGVAPTQIPIPIFIYPVGPMTLEVDAGVSFEGQIDATLSPGLSYPLQDSTLDAKLTANLSAGGFIEGYANLWLLRAGVGGEVDLIDGTVGVTGHIYMNGQTPSGQGMGMVHMLDGDLFGFVDDRFFFGVWSRIYTHDFYKWAGYCYSFGATACATP
jgi:hypothetical protein